MRAIVRALVHLHHSQIGLVLKNAIISTICGNFGSGGRDRSESKANPLIYRWIRASCEISSKGLVTMNMQHLV